MTSREDALWLIGILSTNDWRKFTQLDFSRIEEFINSDGCTGVPEFYHNGCVLHDFCYRTHFDFYGNETTKESADLMLRDYIRSKSWFGRFSPMAWWRWEAVKYLAEKAWEAEGE